MAPGLATPASPSGLRYGPFTVVSDAGETGNGRLFIGFDPVLRREVWIQAVPQHTPPTSAARRDVSRIGRLHWLTGRRSAEDSWDAFEAPDGGPFLTRQHTCRAEAGAGHWGPAKAGLGWPTLKMWLLDLASELAAAAQDDSTPALRLDRLWLRDDGHLVLLDFPTPASAQQGLDRANLTPVGLLSAVAARAVSVAANTSGAPVPIPLSARALFNRWSGPTPPDLDAARAALIEVAAAQDRVWWGRRAVPIALASAPILLLLASALLMLPYFFRFANPQNLEMVGWLELLGRPDPPADSRLADPEIRDTVERYVAGRYHAALTDDRFWDMAVMQQRGFGELRRSAAELAARHPSVSAEELARISAVIAPQIQRAEQRSRSQSSSAAGGAAIIISTLTAVSLTFVLCCSVLSSVLVPGGVVTRLLGLAVVTRNGEEISRWRSLARALIAWLPAIVWLAYLGASPKIQGWVPAPASPMLSTVLVLAALAIGATWAIARPTRGPHDWLVGTWIVPR